MAGLFILTQEMLKFLNPKIWNYLTSYLKQRACLQTMIENKTDENFVNSELGKNLLAEIQNINQIMEEKLQISLNQLKKLQCSPSL